MLFAYCVIGRAMQNKSNTESMNQADVLHLAFHMYLTLRNKSYLRRTYCKSSPAGINERLANRQSALLMYPTLNDFLVKQRKVPLKKTKVVKCPLLGYFLDPRLLLW